MQTRKIEESDWKTQVQKEMSVVTQVSKHAGKFKAGSKGILGNSASGIGTDQLMRLVDNVFGSPVQNIASVNVPVIGTVGPIDFLNYLVHAGKLGFKKEGLIAVLAAKVRQWCFTKHQRLEFATSKLYK